MPKILEIQDAPIFSYRIASADMRYIEIGSREIYLRDDPQAGLIFRGEIPYCGPGCFIGLNEILLEYAMSCEGCREQSVMLEEGVWFGEHLADLLLDRISSDIVDLTTSGKLSSAFKCVLNSMNAPYTEDCKEDRLELVLEYCPLCECAGRTGLSRSVEMAQIAFTALCNHLVKAITPDWKLTRLCLDDLEKPIKSIVIAKL